MAIKKTIQGKEVWLCGYCGKKFNRDIDADKCRDDHELILVQFSRNDFNRLLQFLYTRNEELLTDTLINTLNKHKGSLIVKP